MTVFDMPGLTGLEIWHGMPHDKPFPLLRESKEEYFTALRDFLLRLHEGTAVTADPADTLALQPAKGFRVAVLCGGEARHPLLRTVLQAKELPFSISIDEGGEFVGRRGAQKVFNIMRWQNGVALDLGQTQLKVMTERGSFCIPRDLLQLPLGAHALSAETGRARLRTFIEEGLRCAGKLISSQQPDGVVLALPVALDKHGIAQSATYPGLWGPVEPIFSDLFPQQPWVVLNDAVLAALALCRPPEKTLVVTLGFGVGGALWDVSLRSGCL